MVSTRATGLMLVILYDNVAKIHAYMRTKRKMDVYQGSGFYVTNASFRNAEVDILKHQKANEISREPVGIVHMRDKRYSYLVGAHLSSSDSSVNAVHHKSTLTV